MRTYEKPLDERLLQFASRVIELIDQIPRTSFLRRNGDQLARAATSIGANYEEATGAESKADFVHKMQVALKESRETCYWLRLVSSRQIVPTAVIDPLLLEAFEIRAMLIKSVLTSKGTETQSAKTVNGKRRTSKPVLS